MPLRSNMKKDASIKDAGTSSCTYSAPTPKDSQGPPQPTATRRMVAGSTAGLVDMVLLYPIDVIKTRMQYEPGTSTCYASRATSMTLSPPAPAKIHYGKPWQLQLLPRLIGAGPSTASTSSSSSSSSSRPVQTGGAAACSTRTGIGGSYPSSRGTNLSHHGTGEGVTLRTSVPADAHRLSQPALQTTTSRSRTTVPNIQASSSITTFRHPRGPVGFSGTIHHTNKHPCFCPAVAAPAGSCEPHALLLSTGYSTTSSSSSSSSSSSQRLAPGGAYQAVWEGRNGSGSNLSRYSFHSFGGATTSAASDLPPPRASSFLRLLATSLRQEKLSIYRGLSFPLLTEVPKRGWKFMVQGHLEAKFLQRISSSKEAGIANFAGCASPSTSSVGATRKMSIATRNMRITPPPPRSDRYQAAFAAGALTGASEAPIVVTSELIKVRMQLPEYRHEYNRGLLDAMAQVYRKEGPVALIRGMSCTMQRGFLFNGVFFSSVSWAKDQLSDPDSMFQRCFLQPPLLSSGGATSRNCTSSGEDFSSAGASLSFSTTKLNSHNWCASSCNILPVHFLSGCFAGVVGAIFSAPFDLVKTRIQASVGNSVETNVVCPRTMGTTSSAPAIAVPKSSLPLSATSVVGGDILSAAQAKTGARTSTLRRNQWSPSALGVMFHILRREGVFALYRGFVPRLARCVPGAGISLFVYQTVLDYPWP
ncbi:unnamed protein product [Amoebophrya sp. A120]|nr:unnamed protein product [Amoebophrya sp. A120]|eukprot:GSA120T00017625001.1